MDAEDSLNSSWVAIKARAAVFWRERAERERWALGMLAGALALLLIWSLGLHPALKTLHDAPLAIQQLDTELEHMRVLAIEADRLRQTPSVSSTQSEAALRAATSRLGEQVNLNLQGERATVSLTDVPGWALAAWLSEVRVGARARPESAQLTKSGDNTYSGTVVLVIGHTDSE